MENFDIALVSRKKTYELVRNSSNTKKKTVQKFRIESKILKPQLHTTL